MSDDCFSIFIFCILGLVFIFMIFISYTGHLIFLLLGILVFLAFFAINQNQKQKTIQSSIAGLNNELRDRYLYFYLLKKRNHGLLN